MRPWPVADEVADTLALVRLRRTLRRRALMRRVIPWLPLTLALLAWATIGHAQAPNAPTFYAFADTAGISQFVTLEDSAGVKVPTAHPGVYITWIQARTSPTSLPSSAVLVAWDCEKHLVKRLAQIKYQLRPDSIGVQGSPEEVDRDWQAPTNPRLFDDVCRIGPTHQPAVTRPTHPAEVPAMKPPSPYRLS